MDKRQLRRCFDRIQPSEALIRTTCNKIEQARSEKTSMPKSRSYGFAYRLATAACALLLVIGVGVALGKNAWLDSDLLQPQHGDRIAPTATGEQPGDGDATPSDESQAAVCAAMAERAQARGGNWLVVTAQVDAVSTTQSAENGGLVYMITISSHTIVVSGGENSSLDFENGRLALSERVDAQTVTDAVGSPVCLRLHAQGSNTVWVVEELTVPQATGEGLN